MIAHCPHCQVEFSAELDCWICGREGIDGPDPNSPWTFSMIGTPNRADPEPP